MCVNSDYRNKKETPRYIGVSFFAHLSLNFYSNQTLRQTATVNTPRPDDVIAWVDLAVKLALTLFVLRLGATNNTQHTFATNNFAIAAYGLNRSTNFHC
jgi:hypothetical protein